MFGKREPERTELTPELAALERQLWALAISPPRIDRDKLMFEAGRAAASRPRWSINLAGPPWGGSRVWPAATAMMTAASVLLATMLILQRDSARVVGPSMPPVVSLPIVAQPPIVQPAWRSDFARSAWLASLQPSTGYLGIRQAALMRGVKAIEPTMSAASNVRDTSDKLEPSQRRMLNELLPGSRIELMPRS
jgi:hypothetical protein